MPRDRIFLSIGLALVSLSANSQTRSDLPGEHEFGFRSRYQQTQDDWFENATALTTRLILKSNFVLDPNEKWRLFLQPNFVAPHIDDYNSIADFNSRSIIPDTKGPSLTQGLIGYDGITNWRFKLGRQSLSYDNERMVGNLEYWQTPQSFDAFSVEYRDEINWHIQYAYSNRVHRIFGPDAKRRLPTSDTRYDNLNYRPPSELGSHELEAHLLHASYRTDNDLIWQAYHYAIDNRDQEAVSSLTTGLKLTHQFKPQKLKYKYQVEFARQVDAFGNPNPSDTWYSLVEASVQYRSHSLQLSHEILSEDNGVAFQTQFGTNHKFQGWADVFAGYLGQRGVRDTYLTYRGRHKKLRWRFVAHDFQDYGSDASLGLEYDLELAYRITRKWEARLVYADFQTNKNWHPSHIAANFDLTTWFFSIAYNI